LAGAVTLAFHHLETAFCMLTPLILKRKNSPFCASQCVWQL
jgi:hypothetical protein